MPRCEADGPTFEAVGDHMTVAGGHGQIHLLGGPGPVESGDSQVSWCAGLANVTRLFSTSRAHLSGTAGRAVIAPEPGSPTTRSPISKSDGKTSCTPTGGRRTSEGPN